MKTPFSTFALLTYALVLTGLAFISKNLTVLIALLAPPLTLMLISGSRRLLWVLLLFLIGEIGVFLNALFFSNTGSVVLDLGFVSIREGAVNGFIVVTLRMLLITSAGNLLVFSKSPVDIFREIVFELGLSPYLSIPLAYSLRILPVVGRDLKEAVFIRRQKKEGVNPLNPLNFYSITLTLMAVNYERAVWSGISAELRGLKYFKPRFNYRVNKWDLLLFTLLTTQLLIFAKFEL